VVGADETKPLGDWYINRCESIGIILLLLN